MKLSRDFYLRPTLEVAPELLGKYLIFNSPQGKLVGQINEVEANIGRIDPAAHSFKGKTKRTEIMFGEGGFSYIYFIYGMYFCLNVITEPEGEPAGVLIRSLIPTEGTAQMAENRGKNMAHLSPKQLLHLTDGPGKLCQAYGLTKEENGIDLVTSPVLYLEDRDESIKQFFTSARIGISQNTDKLWRFYY